MAAVGIVASMTVTRFYDRILEAARRLAADPAADGPTFAAAVVVSATACEVAAARAVNALIDAKALGAIGEVLASDQRSFSFADERLRDLWTALSGDSIQHASFWRDYRAHLKRRNDAVHTGLYGGVQLSLSDAMDSADVAARFIAHLRQILHSLGVGADA